MRLEKEERILLIQNNILRKKEDLFAFKATVRKRGNGWVFFVPSYIVKKFNIREGSVLSFYILELWQSVKSLKGKEIIKTELLSEMGKPIIKFKDYEVSFLKVKSFGKRYKYAVIYIPKDYISRYNIKSGDAIGVHITSVGGGGIREHYDSEGYDRSDKEGKT